MNRPLTTAIALIALAAAGCAREAPSDTEGAGRAPAFAMTPLWTVTGLSSPESVLESADQNVFYVANVNGEGGDKDGNGFISRVSRDGRILDLKWATGLDAPKGMALKGGVLYVADITRLAAVDAATGKVSRTFEAPGAGFLNDVALLPDGRILAADSDTGRIFVLEGDILVPWLADPLLRSVNGLLPTPEGVAVTTMQGKLLLVDPATKAIRLLADGLGEGDGVARLGKDDYLVSEWPGRLFRVTGGKVAVLSDTREAETYMNDFLLTGDVLLVPNWKPGSLSAYRVAR